jgi:hypothetical protein
MEIIKVVILLNANNEIIYMKYFHIALISKLLNSLYTIQL